MSVASSGALVTAKDKHVVAGQMLRSHLQAELPVR